jgi:hypothetical protein
MSDHEIGGFNLADIKELVDFAYVREAPLDPDEAPSEVLRAAVRVDCFLGELKSGERSLLELGDVADDVLSLAAYCSVASPEPVNADLAFDNISPTAGRVGAWFGEFIRARDHVEASRCM